MIKIYHNLIKNIHDTLYLLINIKKFIDNRKNLYLFKLPWN